MAIKGFYKKGKHNRTSARAEAETKRHQDIIRARRKRATVNAAT